MTLLEMESPAFPHGRSVDKREEELGEEHGGDSDPCVSCDLIATGRL